MICTVSYDGTLSRVRVFASAVTGNRVDVDRSLDQRNWTRIRGGTGVELVGTPVSGTIAPPVDDYEFITTTDLPSGEECPPGIPTGLPNFYRISSYNAESMLTVTGGANSFASTPDDPTLDITGDIDIRIGLRPDSWIRNKAYILISKWLAAGDQRSWVFWLLDSGEVQFRWSTNGQDVTLAANSTLSVPAFKGEHKAVRVTLNVNNGLSQNVVRFYTADTVAGPWKQLGEPTVKSGITSIFASTARLEVGAGDNGGVVFTSPATSQLTGDVTKVEIRSGIDGAVRTSPDFTAQSPGTTSFIDAQGKVWTVHQSAFIQEDPTPTESPTITDQCIVSITPVLSGIWLKSIYRPFLNRMIRVLRGFVETTQQFRGGAFNIVGRSVPVVVTDLRGSREWQLGVCTNTAEQTTSFDIMLSSGDPFFLHVPDMTNLPIPSMHIKVGDTNAQKVAFSDKRTWSLPLTEIAAPGADVVGSTSTWQTVLSTYTTWQQVLDNHLNWASVLELVGDESEVLVP